MKQFKFLMIICTFLTGVTFSSCLDDDDNNTSDYTFESLVRVMNSSYFMDGGGNLFYPTTSSLSSLVASGFDIYSTTYAFIDYKLVEESSVGDSYTIELVGVTPINDTSAIIVEDEADEPVETAPIVGLTGTYYYYSYSPGLFDKNTLILPIFWLMTNDSNYYSVHTFTLCFYPEEVDSGSRNLDLYLRHDKGTDVGSSVTTFDFWAYDLTAALSLFNSLSGSNPTNIVVHTKESSSSTELENVYINENSYTISYNY